MVPDFLKLFDSKMNGTHKLVTPRGRNGKVNSTQSMKSARKWKTDLKRRKVQNSVVGEHQLRWFSTQKLTKSNSRVTAIVTKWNNINLLMLRSKIILVRPLNPRIRVSPKTLTIRLINMDLIPITRVLIPKTKFL